MHHTYNKNLMIFTLKPRHALVICSLLALIALGIVGLVLTRDQDAAPRSQRNASRRVQFVDLSYLQTARQLAALASGRDEQRLAREALRLADHQVDLAFAMSLRWAAQRHDEPTPETRGLFDRVKKAESLVKAEQDAVDQLKKQLAATPPSRQDAIQQRINLAQAQLELDQDELQDAQQDLFRSGADVQSRIQRQFSRYQASSQRDQDLSTAQAGNTKPDTDDPSTLTGQFSIWRQLRGKTDQLQAAHDAALASTNGLRQTHDTLEGQIQSQESAKEQLKQQANSQLQSENGSPDSAKNTIASLHEFSDKQKNLSDLDRQIQDHQELADTYANWIALVQLHQRAAIHQMLLSAIWIMLIVLAVYLACRLIDYFLADITQERKTLRTLRVILRFAVQAIGVLVVVFVLFGVPNQMSTVLGLAGAGLTVALKDFIVGFFGWFVLMGKNGIRVGDWVEINGVVGEVVEISWLRTVLLETGNWTDSGHPTGRKVSFVNSFAIEGHFFNFSTSGQWLWDELEMLIPAGQDPYLVIEAIQKLVTEETAANVKKAEQEWQHSTSRYRVQSVSAKPAINLRPTGSGVEVHLRYITSANERYAMRAHLYQVLVELLHGKQAKDFATRDLQTESRPQ
jgi:small-conductance mechanosensitive channel